MSATAQWESLQKANRELQKGLTLTDIIANRSEFGWETVDEYEDDKLALGNADAKLLKKAEKAAVAKVTKIGGPYHNKIVAARTNSKEHTSRHSCQQNNPWE